MDVTALLDLGFTKGQLWGKLTALYLIHTPVLEVLWRMILGNLAHQILPLAFSLVILDLRILLVRVPYKQLLG